jgi:hypothetical protein
MLKFLKTLIGKKIDNANESPPSSGATSSLLPETQADNLITGVQKEEEYFAEANDLINNFRGEEPVISNSNFSNHLTNQWPHKEEYKGYMLLGKTKEDIEEQRNKVDKGEPWGIYGIEQYKYIFERQPPAQQDDDYLVDDVDFLKNHTNYAKPNIPETKTVILQGFPNMDTTADQSNKK